MQMQENLDNEQEDLESIKIGLLARQKELEDRVKAINKDVSHINQPLSSDWSEQAIERENDEVLEALGKASQQELIQIKAALKRIENGTYRNCGVCGEMIPFERIQLLPQTTHCTRCAEELEAAG